MEVIGETLDDAVVSGDKCGKCQPALSYGPLIDKYAQEGNPKAFFRSLT